MTQRAPYAERARLRLALLLNPALTWRAKGILLLCLSLPPGKIITRSLLLEASRESRDAVVAALKELERAGYASYAHGRGFGGHFTGKQWHFSEVPPDSRKTRSSADSRKTRSSVTDSRKNPPSENPVIRGQQVLQFEADKKPSL